MKRRSNFLTAAPAGQEQAEQAEQAASAAAVKPKRDKQQKVFVLEPDQRLRVDMYCAETRTTIQDLVLEGINLVFASKGLPKI